MILTTAASSTSRASRWRRRSSPVGGTEDSRFLVIVNHFKSKGSGLDADHDGQGASNRTRVAQAQALVDFADEIKGELGTDKVFLTGDFNAYTEEDPVTSSYDAGYTDIVPTQLTGRGDLPLRRHGRLARPRARHAAAFAKVTGADVWNINAEESVAREYSRYNYNATDFYQPGPYRASDHDPVVVGLDLPTARWPRTTSAPVAAPVRWLRRPPGRARAGRLDRWAPSPDGTRRGARVRHPARPRPVTESDKGSCYLLAQLHLHDPAIAVLGQGLDLNVILGSLAAGRCWSFMLAEHQDRGAQIDHDLARFPGLRRRAARDPGV